MKFMTAKLHITDYGAFVQLTDKDLEGLDHQMILVGLKKHTHLIKY